MGNPVVHFEIISPAAEKLQQFYAQIFGWKVDADNSMKYGIVNTQSGGRGIGGGIGAPPDGPGHVTFYVAVANIDKTLAEIAGCGGRVVMPKTTVPPSGPTIALFADPAGHPVGLVETGSM